jgi:TorA maturation chaperone TorD
MPIQSKIWTATARAKLARFVAAAFSDPADCMSRLLLETTASREVRDSANLIGLESRLVELVLSIRGDDSEFDALTLLGHTVRSTCPPYELEYRSAEVFQQSQTLADICGFYRAFGFEAAGPVADRADHVAAEWEFLAVLAIKEALAENDAQRACCIDAQKLFLSEHAAEWMPAFFERIRRAGPGSWLARVADLAEALLRHWCADRNVALGSRWLELRPVSEEDSTITCGAPGAVELGPTLAAAMQERDDA